MDHSLQGNWERLYAYHVFPGGSDGKESAHSVGDLGLNPWIGKIPWRRAWLPTPGILAWRIPMEEEPGGLQSMGCRVGHD